MDSLIFVLRNRGLEGRTCVCVSWLSGANSTVPGLCAGRQCSGSRDCPCRGPGVTRCFGADEIGGWGIWASVGGRLLTPRLRAASHQTHQIRAGHDPGGVWLRPLRATRHGAAQGLQGQAGPQVHQEKGRWGSRAGPGLGLGAQAHGPPCPAGGDTHPREEEERGAEQRLGRHEESGSQEGLSPSPLFTINLAPKLGVSVLPLEMGG